MNKKYSLTVKSGEEVKVLKLFPFIIRATQININPERVDNVIGYDVIDAYNSIKDKYPNTFIKHNRADEISVKFLLDNIELDNLEVTTKEIPSEIETSPKMSLEQFKFNLLLFCDEYVKEKKGCKEDRENIKNIIEKYL